MRSLHKAKKHARQGPWRLLRRDGKFNIIAPKRNLHVRDWYHRSLAVSWGEFLAALTVGYLVINIFFACAYFLCGPEALSSASTSTLTTRFLDDFFFSVQTFATIGYGKMTPNSLAANILVTLEALSGLLSVALATGLLFSRFSRPTARVVYSNVAVINNHEGVQSLIFRLANERYNQIVEAQIHVTLSISEKTLEGETYRSLYDLKLERSTTPLFAISWTIVHPIDDRSPLYRKTAQDLFDASAELLITMTGIDDTFAQAIHSRWSYIPDEIIWDAKLKDVIAFENGLVKVLMENFHQYEMLKDVSPNKRRLAETAIMPPSE